MDTPDTRRPMLVGRMIAGRYELGTLLANGGMGAAFRAWDHRLRRHVAVKMVPLRAGPDYRQMRVSNHWRWEANVMAAVSHPHVVHIYDAIEDGDYGYIIMEMVEGDDLKRYVARTGPLPCAEALSIGIQVCEALHALHMRGLIHRDVKPHNILGASTRWVKLADFGLAQNARSSWRSGTAAVGPPYDEIVAAPGILVGTATYCSPEQAHGEPLSFATDIYALGVVLYEVLAGVPPFIGETPQALASLHAAAPVPALHRIRPDIPAVAEQAVLQALAKNPARRFASAHAMCVALTYAHLAVASAGAAPPMRPLAVASRRTRQMNADVLACSTAPLTPHTGRLDPADSPRDGKRGIREPDDIAHRSQPASPARTARTATSRAVSPAKPDRSTVVLCVADLVALLLLVAMVLSWVH